MDCGMTGRGIRTAFALTTELVDAKVERWSRLSPLDSAGTTGTVGRARRVDGLLEAVVMVLQTLATSLRAVIRDRVRGIAENGADSGVGTTKRVNL